MASPKRGSRPRRRQPNADLEEALDLLTALEEASATLRDTEHLAGVLLLDGQIQVLLRKLRLDDGGSDAG